MVAVRKHPAAKHLNVFSLVKWEHFDRPMIGRPKTKGKTVKAKIRKVVVVGVALGAPLGAWAQTSSPDVTTIVSSSSTVFTAVATLCVTIGTFMVGYRLARKVR